MKTCKYLLVLSILACESCQNQWFPMEPMLPVDVIPTSREIGIIEVSESEFFMMQLVPSTISEHSKNKFIVVNYTTYELYWNTVFSLDYFERDSWTPVPINGDWINIGYVLYPGEIFSGETITGQMTVYEIVNKFNKGKKGKYRMNRKATIIELGTYESCIAFEVI